MVETEFREAEILDECLLKLQSGEASLADCLRENPEQAQALLHLLAVADEVRQHLGPTTPSESFAAASKVRLLNIMRARTKAARRAAAPRPRRTRWLRPSFALASLLLAFALITSSVGVVYASGEALPGDPLYRVKRSVEEVRLALSQSARGDANLLADFTDERLSELEALAATGRDENLAEAVDNYRNSVERLMSLVDASKASGSSVSLVDFQSLLDQHIRTLERVQGQVPQPAQEAIKSAIERSSHGKTVIEQLLQGGSPSDLAPGQQKKEEATDVPAGKSEREIERETQTAARLARQYGVTEEEILAVFNGSCESNWSCVRAHFRDAQSGGKGNSGKGPKKGDGGGPKEGKGPNK